jgi:hypothetical protein
VHERDCSKRPSPPIGHSDCKASFSAHSPILFCTICPINRDSWQQILASAVSIFDDLYRKLELPYLVLGGGTVLMFRFEHRLSIDIDFFIIETFNG